MRLRPQTTALLTLCALAGLFLLSGKSSAWRQGGSPETRPAAPSSRAPALDILLAQPFVVAEPFPHTWRAEQPLVSAGLLIVIDVDPAYVLPRETLEPVLYVGDQTAERVNKGYPSGRVVAIVPSARDEQGLPALALEGTPIWFGPAALPEELGAAEIAGEVERARAAGMLSLAVERVRAAAVAELLRFPNRTELERHAAQLILSYVPDEEQNARSMLVPLVR